MFKQCSMCQQLWPNRDDFLADAGIALVGYQSCFEDTKEGLFLFNHLCETTLALKVYDFEDLYEGARYDKALTGKEECSGFCLNIEELSPCKASCKYAYVREIIQVIRRWHKA